MTIEQVYDIINDYGRRSLYISDVAKKLGLSYAEANLLVIKAGYRRSKKVSNITLEQFSGDKSVRYIIDNMTI